MVVVGPKKSVSRTPLTRMPWLSGAASRRPSRESRALKIVYEKTNHTSSPRLVRIRNLVMDRQVTLLNCVDLETGNDRQFRLDRISSATVLDSMPS